MKLSKKIETEVLQVYDIWLNAYLNGDVKTYDHYFDDTYRFIGSTDNEDFLNRKDTTKFFESTAEQLAGNCQIKNNIRVVEQFDGLVFITERFDANFLIDGNWVYYGKFRFTSVLQKKTEGWRFIYQHFSLPDSKAQDGETLGAEQASKENQELRDAIKRRTIELEHKNRELEVEAALERVRSRSMAMRSSDELNDVLSVLFQQFDILNISPVTAFLSLFNIEKNNFTYLSTGKSGSRMHTKQVVDLDALPIWKEMAEKWKNDNQDEVEVIYYPADVLSQLFELFAETFSAMPEEERMTIADYPDGGYAVHGFCKFGYLGYNHTRKPTDEEKEIVSKFAMEFGRVYQRFLDIQNAEAQTKEALIEAALEKVRSKSLTMHKSDEMQLVADAVYEQLNALGFEMHAVAMSGEMDVQNGYEVWGGGVGMEKPLKIPFSEETKVQRDFNDVLLKRSELFAKTYSGKTKKAYIAFLLSSNDFPPFLEKLMLESPAFSTTLATRKNSGLQVVRYTAEPYTDDENTILKRFAKVFEQAYVRFMDLQKAEVQAREAQIEAALERIRSRSMAMHASSELSEVLEVLFNQFVILDINPVFAVLNLYDLDNDTFTMRVTGKNGAKVIATQTVKFSENDIWKDYGEKFRKGNPDIINDQFYPVEILPNVWEILKDIVHAVPKEVRPLPSDFPNGLYNIEGYCKYGTIGCNLNRPPTDEEKTIVIKFATEFGRLYQRFLDIEKAEAQAKESEIQLALERVRARTMAMHNSDELGEVASVLFEQISLLTNTPDRFNIAIANEEDRTYDVWVTDQQGHKISKSFVAASDKSPVILESFEAWKRKEKFVVLDLHGKRLADWIQYMGKELGIPFDKSQVKDHRYINNVFFSHGFIGITTNEPPASETLKLIERFAKVFQQTYTRFLDLQKAESQTRESQIEASLERIRAKAMAMQHTEELNDVIGLLCEQYDILGINPVCAHLSLIDVENNRFSLRLTGKKGARNVGEQIIDANAMPVWAEALEKWRNSEPLSHQCLIYPPEEVPKVLSILDGVISTMPEEARISAADFQDGLFSCEGQNKFGNLGFNHSRPPTEEEIEIVVRFAREFERIYQRFLDLEKAEAQAIEATKQASLERVRGEIASMRSTEDLQIITPLVFNELTTLGVPFIRCGVFIINEEEENVEVYLSAPDGHSLAVLQLPFHANELTEKAVANWRNKKVYHQHWNKEDFVNWTKSMMEQGQIQNQQKYQGAAAPPESLDLHFIPFTQGMLYVGNVSELKEKEIDLVKALAEAFAIAYFRYEDFVKLEKAKESIEHTLSELKSTQSQLIQSEKMASLGELTAGIAHEIQNPLNFVNNFSEVSTELLDEILQEISSGNYEDVKELVSDVKQNLEKINHHGKRADGIVKGMLQHSRSSSGTKEPTDINKLADEYLRLAYHGLRAKDKSFNAKLVTNFDENAGMVNIISQDIGRVVLNLLTNAFYAVTEKKKAGSAGYEPTVTVSTSRSPLPERRAGGEVTIIVRDNGNGIPQKALDKIFQPFFTTKPTGQGTGLGLSLAYDIVTAHGGELTVETEVEKGSTFIITLPALSL